MLTYGYHRIETIDIVSKQSLRSRKEINMKPETPGVSDAPEILTFEDVKKMLGCGHDIAERYIKESGAALPRMKNSPYRVRKAKFIAWLEGN